MKLGILVRSDSYLEHLVGLTRAAAGRGHEVTLFSTDYGVKLLENPDYVALSGLDGVAMSACEHSVQTHRVSTDGLPKAIVRGSQYDNAAMTQWADKVVVL